jgi:F-type H+-transporting ATPase subunit gamma
METLETLGKRIGTTEDLQSIVSTMKALSAVSIHQYEEAAEALQDYSRTIELGLIAALRGGRPPTAERTPARGRTLVVVFGSDHGLCGRFNHELVRFVGKDLHERGMAGDAAEHLVAGARAGGLLETAGASIRAVYPLPGTVAGLTQTAYAILRAIDERRAEAPVSRVRLYHNRRTAESTADPRGGQLWPLDPDWLDRLAGQKWPSRALPAVTLETATLLAALVRQQLFIGLFRAGAESAASEHATRLSAMQAAERNIEEHLDEMNADYRRKRQESITEELLDVVSGFEAMQSAGR